MMFLGKLMKINAYENRVVISDLEYFDIKQTFDCGQCFRFDPVDAEGGVTYEGVAFGKYVRLSQNLGKLTLYNTDESEFEQIWKPFLGLDEDYGAIRQGLSGVGGEYLDTAMKTGQGIRILRQDSWEALCSFIISQNNNIPRIKSLVAALCERYGEKIEVVSADGTKKEYYSFPSAKALYENASVLGLQNLKMGFRAKYVMDAAEKVALGILDLELVREMTPEDAMAVLMSVNGVGPKVASCALLYGLYRTDFFPIDVWMRRIIENRYGGKLDIPSLGKYAGLAQQYMFYHERTVDA